VTLARALEKANPIQMYVYARTLQRQGNPKRAFELYPMVSRKDPNHWISHLAQARLASTAGDFSTAAKEMQLSIDGAPDPQKPFLQPLLKRLEAKQDINR
jgi:predicted Zn-dependent protease